ncbi:MAG TPA: HU family DNA-binding protein [Elusimicrobiota bacterium]|nr:HU family DNA-binding protein [Elusimicrobiota bacterium]
MNKFELIQRVAKDAGVTRAQAIKSVKSLVSAIRDTIRSGDKIF